MRAETRVMAKRVPTEYPDHPSCTRALEAAQLHTAFQPVHVTHTGRETLVLDDCWRCSARSGPRLGMVAAHHCCAAPTVAARRRNRRATQHRPLREWTSEPSVVGWLLPRSEAGPHHRETLSSSAVGAEPCDVLAR